MPVAGLVLTLSSNDASAQQALREIKADARFTLGTPPEPGRLPVVMESDTEPESRQQLRWLEQLPGVDEVGIVSVDFSDLTSSDPSATNHSNLLDDKGVSSS